MRWVVGYGLYLVSEPQTPVRPPASPCMSSSTRYNPYPTPAYLITNNIRIQCNLQCMNNQNNDQTMGNSADRSFSHTTFEMVCLSYRCEIYQQRIIHIDTPACFLNVLYDVLTDWFEKFLDGVNWSEKGRFVIVIIIISTE